MAAIVGRVAIPRTFVTRKKAQEVVTRYMCHGRRSLLKILRQRCETILLIACREMDWLCVCLCYKKQQSVCCSFNLRRCPNSPPCSHIGHKSV